MLSRVKTETRCYIVDVRLPEGVRLLSVFLSSDEYRDLIQHSSSSHVQQLGRSNAAQLSQPVQDNTCKDTAHYKTDTKCSTVATVADTVCVSFSDRRNISDSTCKQTDDAVTSVSSRNDGELIEQKAQHTATQDPDSVPELSTVSDDVSLEMCWSSDDPPSVQTSGRFVSAVNQDNGKTVAQSASATDDDDVLHDAQCAGSEKSRLIPLELYIQGNSQTVFLLFMQQGSLSELDVVKDLVRIF